MRPPIRKLYKTLNTNELIRVAGAVGDTYDETNGSVSSQVRTINTLYTNNIYTPVVGDLNIAAVGAGSQINIGSDIEFGPSITAYSTTIKNDYYYNLTTNDNDNKLFTLSASYLSYPNFKQVTGEATKKTSYEFKQSHYYQTGIGDFTELNGTYLWTDWTGVSANIASFNLMYGFQSYNKSAGIHFNYSSGSLAPVESAIYGYNFGYGAGGRFDSLGVSELHMLRPDLSVLKGIYSQSTNSGTGSNVGYFGYGFNTNATTGSTYGVFGFGTRNTVNSWACGLIGMGSFTIQTTLNEKNWSIYGGHGHAGIFGGSLFVGANTGTITNYHQSYMVAQHIPTKFSLTSGGNLYVSNIAEVKSLLHCQNLITSPSISATSISSGIINSDESTSGLTFSITGSPAMHINRKGNLILDRTVWDDLRVPLTQGQVGLTNAPGFDVLTGSVRAYAFDKNTDEELFFEIQIPHNYKEGSTLYPHIHWCPKDNAVRNVVWGFEYTLATPYGTFGNTTTLTGLDSTSGQLKHQMTSLGSITGTPSTLGISTLIIGRLYRDANNASDTYDEDAYGLSLDIHYEIDSLGSNSLLTK